MEAKEYVSGRLENQIKWYSNKSSKCQKWYKWLNGYAYFFALLLAPMGYYIEQQFYLRQGMAIIGIIIAILNFFKSQNKYHENWINYRTTAELLKHEKFLFLAKAGEYDSADAYKKLVERTESIISSENIDWARIHNEKRDASKNNTKVV